VKVADVTSPLSNTALTSSKTERISRLKNEFTLLTVLNESVTDFRIDLVFPTASATTFEFAAALP
jgi:hypothetical protein